MEEGVMSDTNDQMNEQVENDHHALLDTLKQLDSAFEEIPERDDFTNWKLQRLWQLRDFQNQLQKHFDLEESGGYNEELRRMAPQLSSRIEHLEEDHLKITSDLNHILDVLKLIQHVDSAKLERVKCRVEGLVSFIRRHESEENDVIQEAYYQDFGVGD